MLRHGQGRTQTVSFLLTLSVGACFGGDFVQGLPCASDADCGSQLSCIEGYCGGLGDPALCGNGLRDIGEECDDGNLSDDDRCSAKCLLPPVCGDGVKHESEVCDDGNLVENDMCTTKCTASPEAPILELSAAPIKQFKFSWEPGHGADYYQLFERVNPEAKFVQIGGEIEAEAYSLTVPLHFRGRASYKLNACNALRCVESSVVDVVGGLTGAIGYIKASNTKKDDFFGSSVAISGDGNTLAVGAWSESGDATGVNGDQNGVSANGSGAVYVFVRSGETWAQQAYVKASNTEMDDSFGWSVALSGDGHTLAVGAIWEDSSATDLDGEQFDELANQAGAVYVFVRVGETWAQEAYVKASNTKGGEHFGDSVALSRDGTTLAVGAAAENSNATGVDGEQGDDLLMGAGAVYVFTRSDKGWSQQAYVKATNTGANDYFGSSVALSGDGDSLLVGAPGEASSATGVDGKQDDDTAPGTGAAYVFTRSGGVWSPRAYVKPSNAGMGSFGRVVAMSGDGSTLAVGATAAGTVYIFVEDGPSWSEQSLVRASNPGMLDLFGTSAALSEDGGTLAVGSILESGAATGVDGDQDDDFGTAVGALYVFGRSGANWSQSAYVKPPVSAAFYEFGHAVALSGDGETLISGAPHEGSSARGVGGEPFDDGAPQSGAVYVY